MTGAGQGPRPFRSGFVAVVGRPNVGKSTLVNHLVGRKVAIVSDVPQTTRCRIQGIVNLPDAQIALVDTPGVHRPLHEMNRWMVADSARSIQDVDLVVFMIEAVASGGQPARDLGPGDRFVLSMLPRDAAPVVLAVNKIDLVRKAALLPLVDRVKGSFPYAEVLLISALESQNTHDVASRLAIHLPEGPPLFPAEHVTDPPERFMASELIREKLLHHTRQEIPHETCVMIEGYEETPAGLVRIQATILVDKESQKKIVIGRQGAMLKTVGTEARADLEQLLGAKVFLDLWVKVREGWRDNESILRRLGLGPPA